MTKNKQRVWFLLNLLLLIFVFFVGLNVRFDDLKVWEKRKAIYFLDNEPLFSCYDAFYFARYAKEFEQGIYHKGQIDPFRFVPDNYLDPKGPRYPLIPQLSFLAAKFSSLFHVSIEKFSFYFIPVLACLFAFPLFFLLYSLRLPVAGFLGGLCGVISLIYVVRTSIARLDTDALNLFYPFTIAFCFYGYFRFSRPYNLLSVVIATLFGNLFYWWYPQSNAYAFTTFFCFLLALLLSRKGRLNKEDFLALLIYVLLQIWFFWQGPLRIYYYFVSLVEHKHAEPLFSAYPNILQSISELNKAKSISQISSFVLPNNALFLAGFSGYLFWLFRERKLSLLLFPAFLVGLLVFRSGNRFGMYLAPFLGIGLGIWIHFIFEMFERYIPALRKEDFLFRTLPLLAGLIIGVLIWNVSENVKNYTASPKILAPIAKNLKRLKDLTPDKAWIWTWWDYGYAIAYLGERGVFIDGGTQTTPKTYYVARSFASPSPKEAYNIISFISERGLTGIKEKLKNGKTPSLILEELQKGIDVPPLKHDVFWLFTGDLPRKFGWIGYFGNWNFKTKQSQYGVMIPFQGCRQEKEIVRCRNGLINLKEALIFLKGRKIDLKEIFIVKNGQLLHKKFKKIGLILESVPSRYGRLIYAVDERSFISNFNQMYILRQYDSSLFHLVMDDFPYAVLYKVRKKTREN